jgi:UPF0755 protein
LPEIKDAPPPTPQRKPAERREAPSDPAPPEVNTPKPEPQSEVPPQKPRRPARSAKPEQDFQPNREQKPRRKSPPEEGLRPTRSAKPPREAKPARQVPPAPDAKFHRETKPKPPVEAEDDFNVEFDFDEEYSDVPMNSPIRPNREKRSGCLGGILYAAFIICISLLIASLGWLAATDILGFGNEDEVVHVTIPKDYKMGDVADILHESGLIKYKSLFNLYARFSDADEKIVAGTYALNKNYDYRALVNGMTLRGGKKVEIEVTIPEGYTLKQIFQLLDANRVATEAELWDAAANYDFNFSFLDESTLGDKYRLEGYLFPDTYRFYVGDSPSRAINKMLSTFNAKYTDEFASRAAEMGFTQREIVIIASLIEKEAGNDEERPRISSVIHNRLKSQNLQLLQIDASIHYAISRTGESFSTTVDSPYNTYLNPGLPPGPIANPGLASIKAALNPESTNYYYYALNKQGTHNFFRDFASHSAFVQSDEYGG